MLLFKKSAHHKGSVAFLGIFFILALFLPHDAHAQSDQRCWTKNDCLNARKAFVQETGASLSDEEIADGFYDKPDAQAVCGEKNIEQNGQIIKEKLGFCLPLTQTTTKISFGGKSQFAHIGEFIQYIYRYGVVIGGLLAIVMIIVAGLEWMFSGGNSATIDTAKKRIAKAITGLIILLLSFSILQIVNPNLVNFRLPQIWMINPISLAPTYCDELPETTRVAFFMEENNNAVSLQQKKDQAASVSTYPFSAQEATCGQEFFIENNQGILTCRGSFCSPGKVCVPMQTNSPSQCRGGILAGSVQGSLGFFDKNSRNIIDSELALVALCNNGHTEITASTYARQVSTNEQQFYIFSGSLSNGICENDGGLAGMYLAAEINDESGTFGSGDDDWFAVGRSPNTHTCSVNLSKLVFETLGRPLQCGADSENKNCSCEGIADELAKKGSYEKVKAVVERFLITETEIRNGFVCNIEVNRADFPDLDHTSYKGECDE